eukprot:gb/GECG01002748.1/.p1 GENE.gb/GECG01002748.1/~~gb/GECG01002748.1/.p1  ORF type:complete len:387 (+),score=21.12 gb/GECG01002748.1/:1-1161(+)
MRKVNTKMEYERRGPLGSRGYGSIEFPHFQRRLWDRTPLHEKYTEHGESKSSDSFTLRARNYSRCPPIVLNSNVISTLRQAVHKLSPGKKELYSGATLFKIGNLPGVADEPMQDFAQITHIWKDLENESAANELAEQYTDHGHVIRIELERKTNAPDEEPNDSDYTALTSSTKDLLWTRLAQWRIVAQSVKAVSPELFTTQPSIPFTANADVYPARESETVYSASVSVSKIVVRGSVQDDDTVELDIMTCSTFPVTDIHYNAVSRPAVRTGDALTDTLNRCKRFPTFYKDFERTDVLPQPSLSYDTVVWGYLTLDYVRRVMPLMRSDPLVGTVPVVGLWFRAGQQISSDKEQEPWWKRTLCTGTVRSAIMHFLYSSEDAVGKKNWS